MTREEWAEVEQRLTQQLRTVYLDCDGYLVGLVLNRVGDLKLGITVYVDGWFRGEWLLRDKASGEWPEISRRFLQLRERRLWPAKMARKLERTLGKHRAAEMGVNQKVQSRNSYWKSARSLRRHFCRENSSIELLTWEVYQERLEEKRRNGGAAA